MRRLASETPRCGWVCEATADNCKVASALRHDLPNKGLPPLALLCSYPSALAGAKRFFKSFRPIEQNGKWGLKQKREYVLDENGNRISDGNGDYAFNAVYVHTADTECRM